MHVLLFGQFPFSDFICNFKTFKHELCYKPLLYIENKGKLVNWENVSSIVVFFVNKSSDKS